MDLNLLTTFVVVAETASFSTAAHKLGVLRSSVSRSVAALERELDVQLFARTTRHVALTTAGTALYAKIAPQLASIRESLGTLPEREQAPSGTLRLTAPVDVGALVLPDLLAAFSLRYPDVQLDVRLANQRVDLVAEGFDAALRISPSRREDSSTVARKLSHVEMQVFASPTYLARAGTPRSVGEAAQHAWIGFTKSPTTKALAALTHTKPLWVGDDVLFVAKAVVAGVGLGLVPTFLLREELAEGKVVRVLPKLTVPAGALFFAYPETRHLPRKVSALRDFLVVHFANNPLTPGTSRS
jgi:DNA-binding transcriptional LysR family regulator